MADKTLLGSNFDKWTNQENLPDAIVQALKKHGFDKPGKLSELTSEYVAKHLQGKGLTEPQCRRVDRAIRRLATASTQPEELTSEPTSPPQQRSAAKPRKHTDCGPSSTAGFETNVESFRCLLVGKSGSGKSATGNTILGEKKFDSQASLGSLTDKCSAHYAENEHTKLEVMDCPGLYNTKVSGMDVATMIVQAVIFMNPGPHAILYIVSGINRYTKEEHSVYERLKEIFDNDVQKYIIVIITHADDLEREKVTLDELCNQAPPKLKSVLEECKHRILLFNNNARDKKPQVDEFMKEIRRLVHENGGHYECPKFKPIRESLDREVQKRVQKRESEIMEQLKQLKLERDDLERQVKQLKSQRREDSQEKLEQKLPGKSPQQSHLLQEKGRQDTETPEADLSVGATHQEYADILRKERKRTYDGQMEDVRYKVARDDPSTKHIVHQGVADIKHNLPSE